MISSPWPSSTYNVRYVMWIPHIAMVEAGCDEAEAEPEPIVALLIKPAGKRSRTARRSSDRGKLCEQSLINITIAFGGRARCGARTVGIPRSYLLALLSIPCADRHKRAAGLQRPLEIAVQSNPFI